MLIRLPWQKRNDHPALVHITHIKAGSTWIDGMLRQLFGKKVMPRFGSGLFQTQFTEAAGESQRHPPYGEMFRAMEYRPGAVYPALFITYDEFTSHPEVRDAQRFVVIRDLRDTLTSHYFSLKGTHALDNLGRVKTAREHLQNVSKDEGFLFLFERDLDRLVQIQRSWLTAGALVLRYEDLIGNDVAAFTDLFLTKLDLPVSVRAVRRAAEASRFEAVFKRKLGEVDEKSHGRQGLPGDWRNHFSRRVRQAFHERTGNLLEVAGYEKDSKWIDVL
jgi:lipopolysaccharide transport system ATP-binding protein